MVFQNLLLKTSCTPNSSLLFFRSARIHLHNLHFKSCGGIFHFDKKHHVLIRAALALLSVQDVLINQVIVNNSRGYGLFTFNTIGNNLVQHSAFLHTKMHPGVSESGNAIISFKGHLCNKDNIIVIWVWRKQQTITDSWWMTMFISSSMSVNIIIFNVTAQGNSETNGNLALYLIDYMPKAAVAV